MELVAVVIGDEARRALPVGRVGKDDRGGGVGVVFLTARDEGLFEEGAEAFAPRQAEGMACQGEEAVGVWGAEPLEFRRQAAGLEGAVDGLVGAAFGLNDPLATWNLRGASAGLVPPAR